jgi:hypothetical protein
MPLQQSSSLWAEVMAKDLAEFKRLSLKETPQLPTDNRSLEDCVRYVYWWRHSEAVHAAASAGTRLAGPYDGSHARRG